MQGRGAAARRRMARGLPRREVGEGRRSSSFALQPSSPPAPACRRAVGEEDGGATRLDDGGRQGRGGADLGCRSRRRPCCGGGAGGLPGRAPAAWHRSSAEGARRPGRSMQCNTEAKRSELWEVVERYPEYRLALGSVSNSNSEIIQTAGIECIQCQFRIPGFNAYIQTGPVSFHETDKGTHCFPVCFSIFL